MRSSTTHAELYFKSVAGAFARPAAGSESGEGVNLAVAPVVGAGVIIGLIVGLAGARSLASFLYGVPTSDVATFAAMTIILTAVALAACVIPARRAMRVSPITALRYE